MTEQHNDDFIPPTPVAEASPAVSEPTAPAETETAPNQPSTTRKWLVGAVLVTAGLVAGSGATYALTAQASPAQGQFSNSQGFPGGGYGRTGGGPGGGGMGGPPGSTDGTTGQQDQGTQPSSAPSTQTG